MEYRVIRPSQMLAPYVRYFSALEFNKASALSKIRVFADRYPHLVFQHNQGQSAFFREGHALPKAFISGVKIKPYVLDLDSHEVVTVTFYPTAIKSLFGIDLETLNDQIVDLSNFAPAELIHKLEDAGTYQERVEVLSQFLIGKIHRAVQPDLLIQESIRMIDDTEIYTSLETLSRHFNISVRQLERRFKSATGLAPTLFLRAARFENALKLIKENRFENFANMAYYLEFTDQSHFIKDFKRFSGLTPKTFLSNNQKTQGIIQDNGLVVINHLVTDR